MQTILEQDARTMARSVPGYLFVRVEGNRPCLRWRRGGAFESWTYLDLWGRVADLAFQLERLGLKVGDRVALFSDNRPEWLVCDLALLSVGAVTVPRGSNCSSSELAFILGHSRCAAAIVETPAVLEAMRAAGRGLRATVLLEGEAAGTHSFAGLLAASGRPKAWFSDTLAARRPDELATIVYTSGTTANPKGVLLRSSNLLHNLTELPEAVPIAGSDRFLALLPPWHMFERMVEYVALAAGASMTYTDLPHLAEDLRCGTTVLASVPRIWIGIYERLLQRVAQRPLPARMLFWWAVWWSRRWLAAPGPLKELLDPVHQANDALVFAKVRAQIGADLRLSISGGSSLPRRIDEFFGLLGVPLLNGYGLTEASPVIAVRRLGRNRLGSVGVPLPRTRVRIVGEDGRDAPPGKPGEVWVRGPQVFEGYFDNAEATAAALRDGWFVTGDLGYFRGGSLYLTGRMKELVVLSNGEKVEPGHLEQDLGESPLVLQAVVVGTDRKFLGALIVADAQHFSAHRHQFPGDLREAVGREIARLVNTPQRAKWEHIKAFALLENQFVLGEEITHTLKLKRAVIEEKYHDVIEKMFESSA